METSYDVRVHAIESRTNAKGKVTSYRVSWFVGNENWKEPFKHFAQADAFRSELLTAARKGEAFDVATGRPISHGQKEPGPDWFTLATRYVDSKWPGASPNHRRGISESITDATEVLTTNASGAPNREHLREAMRWATSIRAHIVAADDDGAIGEPQPPDDVASAVRWLQRNTVSMDAFADPKTGPALARAVLERLNRRQDRKPAKASTVLRKRAVLNNLMAYAIETGILTTNPLKAVNVKRPKHSDEVDVRTVVNSDQAARLLAEVAKLGEMGARLEAFFGCMYYAALRPEEVIGLLRKDLIHLPESDEGEDAWGEMLLSEAEPAPGRRWTGTGSSRERRELKHRAPDTTRPVPIHPDLVRLLRRHLAAFPTATGYVFRGPRGGRIADSTYLPYFKKARAAAFTPAEAASPLAETPYALRHAAVSTWLNSGVEPAQVAAWAGHSVAVLMRIYVKCISGHDAEAKRRILAASKPEQQRDARATVTP